MKNIKRVMKYSLYFYIVAAVIYLACISAVVYAAIHFIQKIW